MSNSKDIETRSPIPRGTQESVCVCVPSGRCHSHLLCGCPHDHYFDENSAYKCVLTREDEIQRRAHEENLRRVMNENLSKMPRDRREELERMLARF